MIRQPKLLQQPAADCQGLRLPELLSRAPSYESAAAILCNGTSSPSLYGPEYCRIDFFPGGAFSPNITDLQRVPAGSFVRFKVFDYDVTGEVLAIARICRHIASARSPN